MLSIGVGRMLEEYVRKRKFSRTPEPAPTQDDARENPPSDGSVFCVQRHDATRLHYDFRLEVEGVLKSWAIPKGPSLDPGVRHLAVHVEDHPLEYGSFEGNIPAGEYGGGSVMLWDRGTYELLDAGVSATKQLARGDFKFRLAGEKLRGDFALVVMKDRGKGNEWLLIKKRDKFATPGWNVEDYAWSVLSGRTQEEIAQGLPAHTAKRQSAGDPDRVWESTRPAARAAKSRRKATAPPADKERNFDPTTLKGARAAPLPEWFEPMSASLAAKPPAGEDWLFEVKWDGVRALCFLDGAKDEDELRIYSRSGRRTERQYPELSVLPHFVAARQAILDGEIAVLDDKGVSRFELIQPRIANTDPAAAAHLAHSTPAVLFLFDLLYLDGYDLRNVALKDRRRALEAVLAPAPVVRLSESFPSGEELLAVARENGLEGIVAKHVTSRYESRRSREWLKFKLVNEQEFLICGFTAGERDPIGALVLGLHDDDGKLVWAGNVGTGFTAQTLRDLRGRLEPLISKRLPFDAGSQPRIRGVTSHGVTWVRPELVAMIKFSNWTKGKRLRAPVFLGLRDDVKPQAVHRESPSALLSGTANEASLTIDGHRLKFTNLNKVLFPKDGYTKRDLLNYYDAVAHLILPHLKDRPLSLKRYPNGIDAEYFFQKDMPANQGSWLRKVKIWSEHTDSKKRAGPIHYVFADNRASLLYLTNLACIDQNPWMSRVDSIDSPDFVLIDLDPYECGYDKIVEAALLVRNVLDSIGMTGYPKTTGGDGMHIYVPLEPVYTYEQSRTFAELLARLVIAERPGLFTTPRSVAQREPNRVYFDTAQNAKSKTVAAPYSARAYPYAPVSTPLEWSEVKQGLRPTQFTIRNAPDRFAHTGDLFEGVLKNTQSIQAALERLEKLLQNANQVKTKA
jgi:bifunctional non-homologous end joining protein LigD